jgi:simple sugar transport system substrate-binding protein
MVAYGSGTASAVSHGSKAATLKVGLLLDGAANDGSWNQAAVQGMQSAEAEFGSKIQVTIEQSVPFSSTATEVVNELVSKGYSLFFADTSGWETYLAPVAKAHPNVLIEEADSAVRSGNFRGYYSAYADTEYLAGMMAEGAATNHRVGIIAGFPFPGYFNEINGVALGAQAVYAKAVSQVIYVSSFYDPAKEAQAAKALVAAGATAIVGMNNDPASCEAVASQHIPCLGSDIINGASNEPGTYLGSFMNYTGWAFVEVISDLLRGTEPPMLLFGYYSNGSGAIAYVGPAYNKLVSAHDRALVAQKTALLKAGKFFVFSGPLREQNGDLVLKAGSHLTPEQIITQDYLVQGVVGKT